MKQDISKKETTAVDWLEEKLKQNLKHIIFNNDYVLMESLFLQAKAMYQQQIENAWVDAKISMISKEIKNAEEYYKEKYENL